MTNTRLSTAPTYPQAATRMAPSLRFQFMLSRYISATREAATLSALIEKTAVHQTKGSLDNMAQCLTKLRGGGCEIGWRCEGGLLPRLARDCRKLLQYKRFANDDLRQVCACIDKALVASTRALESLGYGLGFTLSVPPPDIRTLHRLTKQVLSATRRLGHFMSQVALVFRDDENVVFFLLRNSDKLNAATDKPFVASLLQTYPGGAQEVMRFLTRRYTKRGFEQLLPTITEHIRDLECLHSESNT